MTVGELTDRTGMSRKSIRELEGLGLIPSAGRSECRVIRAYKWMRCELLLGADPDSTPDNGVTTEDDYVVILGFEA